MAWFRHCLPVVPARLAYPEIYPAPFCYPSHPLDSRREARKAAALIGQLAGQLAKGPVAAPDVSAFDRERLRPAYQQVLAELAGGAG